MFNPKPKSEQAHEWLYPQELDLSKSGPQNTPPRAKYVTAPLIEGQKETGQAAIGTIEEDTDEATQGVSTGKEEAVDGKIISFARAVEILKNAGYDLEKAREEAVRLHSSLKLVKALQDKGIVKTDDQYGALFDNHTFTTEGVRGFEQFIRQGGDPLAVFNPGALTYEELWQTLIRDGNIKYNSGYGFEHRNSWRKVGPGDFKDFTSVRGLPFYEMGTAFTEAYENALPILPGKPEIVLASNSMSPENRNKSAIAYLEEIAAGAQYIGPGNDLIRWVTQYRNSGRYPDNVQKTLYPDHVVNYGAVIAMAWSAVYSDLLIDLQHPARAAKHMGVRRVWR